MPERITVIVFSLLILMVTSCEKKDAGTFQISVGNKVWITENDIEFYDFSSQLIYLNKDDILFSNPAEFFKVFKGPFSVQLEGREVYKGNFQPIWFSSIYPGVSILVPGLYSNDVVHIAYYDTLESDFNDPRYDPEIISAMKRSGLYRAGLSCTLNQITVTKNEMPLNTSEIQFTFTLKNNDQTDLYILDPDLMGSQLFHYFTNGLLLISHDRKRYYSYTGDLVSPEPWDHWETKWLFVLKKGEQITRTLGSLDYQYIYPGEYQCIFDYPGLNFQLSKKERDQANGRIWMGNIKAKTSLDIVD